MKAYLNILNKKRGFTLIELVVVLTILGILATIGIVFLFGQINEANKSADIANASAVFSSTQLYALEQDNKGNTLAPKTYDSTSNDDTDKEVIAGIRLLLSKSTKGVFTVEISGGVATKVIYNRGDSFGSGDISYP